MQTLLRKALHTLMLYLCELLLTRRSGESIAYADEGYIELTHVKDVSLTSCCTGATSEVARRYAVSLDLKVVYGSSLAENRAVHFLCPPETGSMWHSVLPRLSSAIRFVLAQYHVDHFSR